MYLIETESRVLRCPHCGNDTWARGLPADDSIPGTILQTDRYRCRRCGTETEILNMKGSQCLPREVTAETVTPLDRLVARCRGVT